jgi:hypothetical protein
MATKLRGPIRDAAHLADILGSHAAPEGLSEHADATGTARRFHPFRRLMGARSAGVPGLPTCRVTLTRIRKEDAS